MRARSDVLWLIGFLSLLAVATQVLHRQHEAAEGPCAPPPRAAAAALPRSLFTRDAEDASTMWIPLSNVSSQTAASLVSTQFREARVRCYGPHLLRVQAEPSTVHRISALCRRLDQPTDVSAWYPPQE